MEKIEEVAVAPTSGAREPRANLVRRLQDDDRFKNPHRYVDMNSDFGPLFIENVAQILGCTVDYVRRIPRSQLPVSKVGRRVLYSREDVAGFLIDRRGTGLQRPQAPKQYRSTSESATISRMTSSPRTFDPILQLKQMRKRDRENDKEKR